MCAMFMSVMKWLGSYTRRGFVLNPMTIENTESVHQLIIDIKQKYPHINSKVNSKAKFRFQDLFWYHYLTYLYTLCIDSGIGIVDYETNDMLNFIAIRVAILCYGVH